MGMCVAVSSEKISVERTLLDILERTLCGFI